LVCLSSLRETPAAEPVTIRVALSSSGDADIRELAAKLAKEVGVAVELPDRAIRVPITGLAGALARTQLAENLGPEVELGVTALELRITIPAELMKPGRLPEIQRRARELAEQVRTDARRAARYGMHALASYRPGDPLRPTICLIHGINSSARSFVHMIGMLEHAGFGLVAYDSPFNRDLDESVRAFQRDWRAFRREQKETLPWAVVTHSMGGLLARAYVESESGYEDDVSDLCLIAPPNSGSAVAKTQVLLQLIQGIQSINRRQAGALAHLSDGLGAAADDMKPGSTFLKSLNARPRRAGVRYHILAGDAGFLTSAAHGQVETQYRLMARSGGLLGGLTRLAVPDLPAQLDELTDGRGDGCVRVESTKLEGVSDHEVMHANHVELIRGPLLYPDPGPVACMPWLMKRLAAARPAH
jgi:pimeloyl-ACP methyl ester carboxylesterase